MQNEAKIYVNRRSLPYCFLFSAYCMQAVFDGVGMQHFMEHSAVIRKQPNYKYSNEER